MASANPYDQNLDRNPANFAPLTPLSFLEGRRSSPPTVCRSFTAVVATTWAET
jgi:hypothetical protein